MVAVPAIISSGNRLTGVDFSVTDNLEIATFSPANDLEFTFSCFFYPTETDKYLFRINPGALGLYVYLDTAGNVTLYGETAGGTTILDATSPGGLYTTNQWNHIMISLDLFDSMKRHVYVNGADASMTWNTYTDASGPIGWNGNQFQIAPNTTSIYLQSFYFKTGSYIDLSDSANRRKFLRGSVPARLGTTGELPTGTQASVCYVGTAAEFSTNLGNGGTASLSGGGLADTTSVVRI